MDERVVVVIPYEKGSNPDRSMLDTIYKLRAGVPCKVFKVEDVGEEGWVAVNNRMSQQLDYDYYVYTASDYYPGQDWLKIALDTARATGAGLVGFNDGKWHGDNATAGLVKKEFLKNNYPGGLLFHHGYFMHGADPDLTAVAKKKGEFVYEPLAVLVEVSPEKVLTGGKKYPEDTSLYRRREREGFP